MKTVDFDIKYRDKVVNGSAEVIFKTSTCEYPVRIICWDRLHVTNGAGEYTPIVALVNNTDKGHEVLVNSTANGHVYTSERGSEQALYVRYQDLPPKLTRVKYSIATAEYYTTTLMGIYGYERDNEKSLYGQKIDFINKYAKEHMNSLYLHLKERGFWKYNDDEEWEDLKNFKVGDIVVCEKAAGAWMVKPGNSYLLTSIKNDVFYVDAGSFGELSFNKYDFVDTFSLYKGEKKEDMQPKETFDFSTLKTFEKVLVRHPHCPWKPALFHMYRKECATAPFCVVGESAYGSTYEQCVPFIGNEHLMNTIDEAPPYYGFK